MNSFNQTNLVSSLSNIILVYSPFFNKLRRGKDVALKPVIQLLVALQVKPWVISLLGFIIGILSLTALALFHSYWLFVILMSVSIAFDALDGTLARNTKQVSDFGKYLDFMVDHVLMILMVVSLCSYLNNFYWLLGMLLFNIALYINIFAYSPLHFPTGRIAVFIPCLLGMPVLGLLFLVAYGISLILLMLIAGWKIPFKTRQNTTSSTAE